MIIFIIVQLKLDIRLGGSNLKHKSNQFEIKPEAQQWKMLVGIKTN